MENVIYGIAFIFVVIIVYKINNTDKSSSKLLDDDGREIVFPPWWVELDYTTRKSYENSRSACVNAGVKYSENEKRRDYINMAKVLMAKGMELEMAKIISSTLFPKKKEKAIFNNSQYKNMIIEDNGNIIFSEERLQIMAVYKIVNDIIHRLNIPIPVCWRNSVAGNQSNTYSPSRVVRPPPR